MSAFREPSDFAFTAVLERAFAEVRRELADLGDGAFVDSPDSLTTVADGYDETGWRYCALVGPGAVAANVARCPATMRALTAVPGLRNAGFSLFRPGTALYPHCGEQADVLRCHLALVVPAGDVALRFGDEVRRWQVGKCLVFDDTMEHDAWNRGDGDRVVLIVTFAR